MKTQSNPVVLLREDFDLLQQYISRSDDMKNQPMEMSLSHELRRAIIVNKDAFPKHTIKLNSVVTVMDVETKKVMTFTIVLPEEADVKQNKISVLAPMGAALIGFRQTEEVEWKVPAGMKKFRIMEVINK